MDVSVGKKFQGNNRSGQRAHYGQEVSRVRGYDEEFQKEVEAYQKGPKGTRNQTTSRDRQDQGEMQETRMDTNNG